jgi:hypothetical protein
MGGWVIELTVRQKLSSVAVLMNQEQLKKEKKQQVSVRRKKKNPNI